MRIVITDLTVSSALTPPPSPLGASLELKWQRLEKDLLLHQTRQSSWLHVAVIEDPTAEDLVITDIIVGNPNHTRSADSGVEYSQWESRPAGIWIRRHRYSVEIQAVTGLDVLFGIDSVEPRLHWSLIREPLQLDVPPEIPIARLTLCRSKIAPRPDGPSLVLRTRMDGKFRILQISDPHMVTGAGICKDAIGPDGSLLPESVADPRTVDFVGELVDVEKPDLVVLTGDQLHFDNLDSQSALFKIYAPLIERSVPYAAVFGNHDDEGKYALSRKRQMDILQQLPYSLCSSGPEDVDGVGNYYLQVFHDGHPAATLYLLDSHGERASSVKNPDYDYITQGQIDWFTKTSQDLRACQERHNNRHLSLVFFHIPLPEFANDDLILEGGQRGEPTEGPSTNSHCYDALVSENVSAIGCGHDHVNDFCALVPGKGLQGPWLCHGGGTGFGGYGSYGNKMYHRRARIWEFDANTVGLKTWKRLEYSNKAVDELVLVQGGKVVAPTRDKNKLASDGDIRL